MNPLVSLNYRMGIEPYKNDHDETSGDSNYSNDWNCDIAHRFAVHPSRTDPITPDSSVKTVLIVDDEETSRRTLADVMVNGQEAW